MQILYLKFVLNLYVVFFIMQSGVAYILGREVIETFSYLFFYKDIITGNRIKI